MNSLSSISVFTWGKCQGGVSDIICFSIAPWTDPKYSLTIVLIGSAPDLNLPQCVSQVSAIIDFARLFRDTCNLTAYCSCSLCLLSERGISPHSCWRA